MSTKLNRRDFLKLSALGLVGLALRPLNIGGLPTYGNLPPGSGGVGRIAVTSVSVHSQPWDESKIIYQRYRDELVHLYYEVVSDKGPDWNPIWYRVWGGYIHSKHLQIVQEQHNEFHRSIPEAGQLAEVTVPFVQSMRPAGDHKWDPLYRLYYGSVHWVTNSVEGPDGRGWYRIQEAWAKTTYDVPADSVRLIPNEELSPISPDIPWQKKRIEVSIGRQELTAFENDQVVLKTKVSTGLSRAVPDGEIPWTTPSGEWNVTAKMPSQHMGEGNLTSDVEAYELAGVPWVCYFHINGNATHGTYWHTNYGNAMSHGCVNMRSEDSKWLFRWAFPVWEPGTGSRDARGYGTPLIVG